MTANDWRKQYASMRSLELIEELQKRQEVPKNQILKFATRYWPRKDGNYYSYSQFTQEVADGVIAYLVKLHKDK